MTYKTYYLTQLAFLKAQVERLRGYSDTWYMIFDLERQIRQIETLLKELPQEILNQKYKTINYQKYFKKMYRNIKS